MLNLNCTSYATCILHEVPVDIFTLNLVQKGFIIYEYTIKSYFLITSIYSPLI